MFECCVHNLRIVLRGELNSVCDISTLGGEISVLLCHTPSCDVCHVMSCDVMCSVVTCRAGMARSVSPSL